MSALVRPFSATVPSARADDVFAPPPQARPGAPIDRIDKQSRALTGYRAAIQKDIADEQATYARLGLTQKPDARAFAKFHDGLAPRGVAVLLHGFSAGTKQWQYIVDDIYNQGYDVYVPALPGHGLLDKNGQSDTSLLPDERDDKAWDAFSDHIYDLVKPAARVSLVGLSAGGVVAMRMAERHGQEQGPAGPVIKQVVAVAPFLSPAGDYAKVGPIGIKNSWVAAGLRAVHHVLPELVDKFLDGQKMDIQGPPNPLVDYGFRYANQDQVLALTDAGQDANDAASALRNVPTQFIVSAADERADPDTAIAAAKAAGASLFVFPQEDHVPHAMVSPLENHDGKSVEKVREIILARLTAGDA